MSCCGSSTGSSTPTAMATPSSSTTTGPWAHVDVVMRQTHRAGEKLFVDFPGMRSRSMTANRGGPAPGRAVRRGRRCVELPLCRGTPLPGADVLGHRARPRVRVHGRLPRDRGLRQPSLRRHPAAPLRARRERHLCGDGCALRGRRHPDAGYKPRDKAKVEAGVLLAERWVIARLRHRRFFSLAEANAAIRECVGEINARPFKKMDGCRQSSSNPSTAPPCGHCLRPATSSRPGARPRSTSTTTSSPTGTTTPCPISSGRKVACGCRPPPSRSSSPASASPRTCGPSAAPPQHRAATCPSPTAATRPGPLADHRLGEGPDRRPRPRRGDPRLASPSRAGLPLRAGHHPPRRAPRHRPRRGRLRPGSASPLLLLSERRLDPRAPPRRAAAPRAPPAPPPPPAPQRARGQLLQLNGEAMLRTPPSRGCGRSGCTRWPPARRTARTARLRRALLRRTPRHAHRPRAPRTVQPTPRALLEDREAALPGHDRGARLLTLAAWTATDPQPRRVALGPRAPDRAHRPDRGREDLPRLRTRPRRDPPRPLRALSPRTADVRRARDRPRRRAARPAHGELGTRRRAAHRRLSHPAADADQAADLLEVVEDRAQQRSTILTSQLPVATGTRPSATRPSRTPSWTGCSNGRTASSSSATPCARPRPRHHHKQAAHDTLPRLRRAGHYQRTHHRKRRLRTPCPRRPGDGRLRPATDEGGELRGQTPQASAATRPPTPPSENCELRVRKRRNAQLLTAGPEASSPDPPP